MAEPDAAQIAAGSRSRADRPTSPSVGRERTIGLLCAGLSVILFSSFTLISRLGLSSALGPLDIAALRFGIGGAVLLPVLLRRGLGGIRWTDAALLALSGGFGFALLAYGGFALAPAAHGAVLLHGTLPLTTLAIQLLMGRRQLVRLQMLGMGVIAAGVGLMAFDSLIASNAQELAGDVLLLLASGSWSTYGVMLRRLGLAPAQGAAIVAVFSGCAFLPIYLLAPGKALLAASAHDLLLQGTVQGVLIGAVSIFVYSRAVAALGPSTAALFTAAVPCVTTLAAAPLLSETPTVAGAGGVAIVTLGMLIAARGGGAQIEQNGSAEMS